MLAASGDYGTAGAPPVEDKCMDKFFPTWPAASPWVSESVPAEHPEYPCEYPCEYPLSKG